MGTTWKNRLLFFTNKLILNMPVHIETKKQDRLKYWTKFSSYHTHSQFQNYHQKIQQHVP